MNVAPTPHPVPPGACNRCLGLGMRWHTWPFYWRLCGECRGTGRMAKL